MLHHTREVTNKQSRQQGFKASSSTIAIICGVSLCHEALDQPYVLSLYPVIVRLMEETLVRDLTEANQNDVDLPLSRYTSSQILIE